MIITALILTVCFYPQWAWFKTLNCFSNLVSPLCSKIWAKDLETAQITTSVNKEKYKSVWDSGKGKAQWFVPDASDDAPRRHQGYIMS